MGYDKPEDIGLLPLSMVALTRTGGEGIGDTTYSGICLVFHLLFAAQQEWQEFVCFLNSFEQVNQIINT